MQVVLIMFRNGGERRSFSVVRDVTTIGRREDCDLRIPVGDVSRKHCRLVVSADNVRVQDLGSSNGTFVNGQQVQDAFLNPGDTISVGPVNFVVQVDGVPGESDLSSSPPAGDTGAGGTALAVAALTANESADIGEIGDAAEVGDLLEPLPDEAGPAEDDLFAETASTDDDAGPVQPAGEAFAPSVAAEPTPRSGSDLTVDELPAGSPEDAAFDLIELDDDQADASAPLAEAAAAAPAAGDDWDFLIEPEAAKGGSELDVDLDEPHEH